jgi:hypothetical protein
MLDLCQGCYGLYQEREKKQIYIFPKVAMLVMHNSILLVWSWLSNFANRFN